jgi:hypothetical protein
MKSNGVVSLLDTFRGENKCILRQLAIAPCWEEKWLPEAELAFLNIEGATTHLPFPEKKLFPRRKIRSGEKNKADSAPIGLIYFLPRPPNLYTADFR